MEVKTIIKHLFLLVLWIFTLLLLVVLLPVVLLVFMLRSIEALIYHKKYGCQAIRNTDILWTFSTPENPMNISGVFQLDGQVELQAFKEILKARLIEKIDSDGNLIYPQTKQHLEAGFINYYWMEDKDFNMSDHVYYIQQDPTKTESELQDLISQHLHSPFPVNPMRSPWEFALVPHLSPSLIPKTIVVFRLKHAIADGSSLAYFLINQLADSSNQTGTMVKKFTQNQRAWLNFKAVWYLPWTYVKIMFQPEDKNVLHSTKLSGIKKYVWSQPIDLDSVKRMKNKLDGTVNDVLIGCLSKSVCDYIMAKSPEPHNNKPLSKQNFTTVFAVDTRSSISEAQYFRNQVAGIVFQLPINLVKVTDIVTKTKSMFDQVKHTGEPISTNLGWHFLSFLLPATISKYFVFKQVSKTTACISNLMGPQYPVSIMGHHIDFLCFWPPGTYTQTMSFSFCSYNEQIRLGLEVDSEVMQDPTNLIRNFETTIKDFEYEQS